MERSNELERDGAIEVAKYMALAARTAPKTCGIDNIEVAAINDRPTKKKLAEKMKELSKKENRPSLERDANLIEDSPAIIVIGVKSNPAGLNCGFCGYTTCAELRKTKGICAYNSIDLGIAIDSAAGIANSFHADNRVMYSIGRACLDLKIFSQTVKQALGIPLSVTGKNPFFDRK
ncbi:MAG: hypothetical protein A3C51_00960 [Omnitrophica bacterium RIFCSPHIGHO2_02_FULL_46_20]|nr:MAG: hypothetical protein A3C51_00960 [Omnitrophica bacterium RIFCSPHIGHO2_02_FULL_46_20]